jgi:hypothetical protein
MRGKKQSAAGSKSKTKAGKGPAPNRREPTEINEITDRFLREIRSLQFAQEETFKVLTVSVEKHVSAFANFLKLFENIKDGTQQKFMIPIDKGEQLRRLIHDLTSSVGSLPLFHRGLFLVLVSKWDAFFGSLLRWTYRVKPEIVDNSARTISFAELKQINSVELARSKIVEDEVSVVLRDSHGDQFDYLEKKLSVALKKIDIWPKFVELTQRRNLIAHADGRVSSQYISICRQSNVDLGEEVILGARLEISPKYLTAACDCLAELGLKLSQVLWRKLQPSDSAKTDNHLLQTTFEMIKAGQYDLAIRILTFSLTSPMKFEEARSRYVSVVNLAQAYKWTGNQTKCAEILQGEDWSAVPLDLKLAVSVLRDEFEEASSLMKQIGTAGQVSKEDYQEWPLFKKFRATRPFVEAYREIFKTEIEVSEVPSELASVLAPSKETVDLPKRAKKVRKGKRAA